MSMGIIDYTTYINRMNKLISLQEESNRIGYANNQLLEQIVKNTTPKK